MWEFFPVDGSPWEGKVHTIADPNKNKIRLEYDGMGRLALIRDTLDAPDNPRTIVVTYNREGFIESLTDFVGRRVRYEYYRDGELGGSPGDLKSVTTPAVTGTPHGNNFPNGKTTRYTYSTGFADPRLNGNLLTITDAKGRTFLRNQYAATQNPTSIDFDRLVRQTWGDADQDIKLVYVRQVPSPQNNFAFIKAIANDRAGNVKECFYDQRNRLVMHQDYTGRADRALPTTDADNRPSNPLRPEDPDFFETRYAYNEDSLLTQIIFPNQNSTENVYELELNPQAPRRSRGNLREVHRLPGPLGGDPPQSTCSTSTTISMVAVAARTS